MIHIYDELCSYCGSCIAVCPENIIDLIDMCDIIITITPQGWAGSTIILESMILGKPVVNIVLDDKKANFEYLEKNAAISVSYNDSDNQIRKLINDVEYRDKISKVKLVSF